ncbi:MAG: glycosyltransferase family 9 protein [Lachnospiraceae bacterium]|nr:glycosyltransferase family 9 protein [Lachnospiraceae bacterium]
MGTIKRWLGLFFSQWSDIKKIRENRKVKESDGTVLILRLDAIGDFILFLDSARAYREIFPNRQLVLLCNKACVPFAEQSGYFDRCITREELPGGLKNCEILIQTVYAKTREIDVIAASIPAVRKISIRPDDSKVNLSRALTIRRIRKACDSIYDELIDTGDERLMELDRNAAFIRGLGKKDFRSNVPELKPLESEALNQDILGLDRSDVSKERASTSPNPYYIVFPGASSRNKMWAAENYAEVIGRIYQETGLECVVCGAPGEEWIFEELLRWLQKKGTALIPVDDRIGRTSLLELAELIRGAEFLIGNDTSGIHIAAAVGTKSLCIAGDFVYGRFIPYRIEGKTDRPLPAVVHAGMCCQGCAYHRKTLKCLCLVFAKRQFECISKISAKTVIQALFDNKFI